MADDEKWSPERRPTGEMVKAEVESLLEMWGSVHSAWAQVEAVRDREYDIWPGLSEAEKAQRPVYHSARPSAYISKFAGQLLTYSPKFKRSPKKGSLATAEDMTKADMKIEPFLKALWEEASGQEHTPVAYQLGVYLGMFNYAVLEGPVVDEVEPTKDEKFWNPIRLMAPHPASVLLNPFERKLRLVVKRGIWFVRDLLEMAEERGKQDERTAVGSLGLVGQKPFEVYECYEYWTEEWHAFLVGEKDLLFVEPNEWGFIPFQFAFGHFGQRRVRQRGDVTGASKSDLMSLCKGILEPIRDDIKLEDQRKAAQHDALMTASFTPIETTEDLETAQEKLGKPIRENVEPGKTYAWAKIPEYPPWMFAAGQETREDMDYGTFSPVLAGFKPKATPTVGGLALMERRAALEFVPEVIQIGNLATQAARKCLQLVEKLGSPVWAGGNKLEASDINGNYAAWAEFENLDPIVKLDERQMANEDLDKERISYLDWADAVGREDAMGTLLRTDFDRVRKSPALQEVIARIIELGLGLDKLKAQLGIQTQPPGLVGPDGKPVQSQPGAGATQAATPPGQATGQPQGNSMEALKAGLLELAASRRGAGA